MIHTLRLRLDLSDRLVLLLDEHGHFVKHLRELGKGLFNLLDLGVAFLHLAVGAARSAIAVRVEQLRYEQTHSLGDSIRMERRTACENTCGLSDSVTCLTSSSVACGLTILYCLSTRSLTFFLNSFSITWCSCSKEVKRVLHASTWAF